MSPRSTLAALVCLGVFAGAPSAALAARGDGPYTPFPEDPTARALDYLNKLNREVGHGSAAITPARLERGVLVPEPPSSKGRKKRGGQTAARVNPADHQVPFEQAGVDRASDPPSPPSWPFAVLAAVLAAGALASLTRTRRLT